MAKTDKFRYSDLDFNFGQSTTKDVARKFDNNAIKQSLRNVVLPNFYERPFRPSLGANIVAKLFDQPSPSIVSEVQSDIRRAIRIFEPRINLRNVLVEYNDLHQELKVEIEYSFLDEEDAIDITIERVR